MDVAKVPRQSPCSETKSMREPGRFRRPSREMTMSNSLLLSRRFAPLFWCQFFAAFNDNFLKNALILLILFKIGGAPGESLVTLAGAIFIAPYFILSALGGQIADKFDKALVAQRLELVEIAAAGAAVLGFQLELVPVLLGALFYFGTLGALFGPTKYGILLDHLRLEDLPSGNALIEGATFLAILTGTALASTIWIYKAVVVSPFRDFLSIVFRAFYRLEVKGLNNLEKAGPNPIIALNHVSFLDAALILSVSPTAGAANILAGCASAKGKTLITSRGFVEKGKLDKLVSAIEESVRIIYLVDVGADVSWVDKLRALIGHRRALAPREADDPAVILFTSGSEGAPKGVVLSHKNMLANVAQAAACIDFGRTDKVFNVLPIFHCFGLNAGFVLPLVSGVPVYLYHSPFHYKIVPELVYASNATVLFGTDLSLSGYARVANAYDFRSIRYILAGAEPVKEATRNIWSEKFGIRILEGYGVTETSPVLALNTPTFNNSARSAV
jgi:AMP-binding enzyme